MNKEIINEINNNLILLVEGFEDAERDYAYDLANEKHYVSEIIELVKKLTLTDVSQRSELLGCEHNVITITDRDEGVCADCGVKMIRTWQPNCG